MKKYIRTKDKVCEITEWQCDLSGEMFLVKADNKFGNDKVFVEDIIAEADTIKELVDMFVIKNPKNGCLDIVSSLGVINVQLFNESGLVVYGAIWTDKGLIYVAKMNEKGELVLL